nr:PREDICTED: uncharacterized protein LOC105271430 [Fopius arisanus]
MSREIVETLGDDYGPHLDTLRTFFVSSLENRIYEALETFVYNDKELLSKFPNLRRCVNFLKLFTTIYQSRRDPDTGLLEQLMRYSFKYLIKDGLITGFINAILLDNRLKRVCRDLDSLSVDKHFFKFLQLPGIISSSDETLSNESGECAGALMIEAPSESGDTKRAVKRKAPDDPDDPISSEKSFGLEDHLGAFDVETLDYWFDYSATSIFIDAILRDNRLKLVCRDQDSLSVDKHFFEFLQLSGIISSSDETLSNESGECAGALMIEASSESGDTKRAVKRKAPDDPDDPISSEKSFVALTPARAKNSHHRRIIKNITSCGPSTCSFLRYRTTHLSTDYREKNLKLKIDKGNAGGIDEEKLILPCQSETIIDDLITSDPSVMISCFGNAKKKFKAQIRKICAIVNRILGRIDKKRVKKCVLYCKILERSILFSLKERGRNASRSCLLSGRVVTRKTSKVSAETVAPEQGEENDKIEDKSQNFLPTLEAPKGHVIQRKIPECYVQG